MFQPDKTIPVEHQTSTSYFRLRTETAVCRPWQPWHTTLSNSPNRKREVVPAAWARELLLPWKELWRGKGLSPHLTDQWTPILSSLPKGTSCSLPETMTGLDSKKEQGIIQKSVSEYASPLVMVWKKVVNPRISTNFRWLKARTLMEA